MFEFKYKPEKNLGKNILKMTFPHHSRYKNSARGGKRELGEEIRKSDATRFVRRSPDR